MDEEGKDVPTFDELSNYRGARKLDLLGVWCTYFFPAVVGTWTFKRNAAKNRLSNFVTVSDEAFALTVLENFYDCWSVEGKKKVGGEKINTDNLPVAKWTDANGAMGKNNKCGWSNDGILQFNVHKTAVEMHRKMDESIRLEEAYMVRAKNEESAMRGRGDRSKRKNDEVVSKDEFSPLPEKRFKKSNCGTIESNENGQVTTRKILQYESQENELEESANDESENEIEYSESDE
jgi:hypothetical protein